jgi:outer membrane protein TolC
MPTKSVSKSRAASTRASVASREKTKLTPTRNEIARRAYELYEARGKNEGREQDDWLQAERELMRPARDGH